MYIHTHKFHIRMNFNMKFMWKQYKADTQRLRKYQGIHNNFLLKNLFQRLDKQY